MALKIRTVMTYPLDGSTVDFMIPFEYLARKFVTVTLVGVDRKELVLNQDYRFTTKTQITTTRGWGSNDGYTLIEIRRYTSATERLVDFADGSILRAYDLNISQVQTLHVAEEARDLTADTIGVNNDGHLDARGRRIVNLALATGDYDAVPLKQIKDRETSVWNAEARAKAEADRSYQNAQNSKGQADLATREADRARSEANSSASHSQNSNAQADRSNMEANRAKGYADSMVASVAATKEHADRSMREADRSKSEADRAAGEVAKAAAEVTKAAAEVTESKTHADRSNTEANRSKSEADRAKTEADKLGNMNEFAGTLEKIEGTNVTFKSNVTANVIETKGGSHLHPNQIKLITDGASDQHFIMQAWGSGDPSQRAQVFELKDNLGAYAFYIQRNKKSDAFWDMKVNGSLSTRDMLVEGSMTATGHIESNHRFHSESAFGSGGYNAQLNNNGIYSNQLPGIQDDNVYYPLIKQFGRRSNGYLTAFSMGMTSSGTNAFHNVTLQLIGDGGTGSLYTFDIEGTFMSSAGWHIPSDGNLYIKKYNSFIDGWVNKRLVEHAYNKTETDNLVYGRLNQAQGDARYFRKNAGWQSVWSDDAGLSYGQSVTLSQDVRWRTIWFRTKLVPDSWASIQIGDNGQYMVRPDNGWVRFAIEDNGRTLRLIKEIDSNPIEVRVYTD
ncbi:non-contractile tail fiber protein [Pectobacterium phage PcCB251]|uniref:Non-contractile tail fiber protein n=1 Tax=Pectobacterium phage PcCB251 TaxID=2798045 RepID=A0AAE7PFB6_9CAUD|nr:non-contractile tail fiber protein [Pectobacterium phage PcCB251]